MTFGPDEAGGPVLVPEDHHTFATRLASSCTRNHGEM